MTSLLRVRAGAALLVLAAVVGIVLMGTGPGGAAAKAALTVVGGQGAANSGLNFNGTAKGHLVITVPVGAQVEITLTNKGDLPHSLQVIPNTSPSALPATAVPAGKLAFPGAQTPNPETGINKGQSAVARFTASKPGRYLLICGFPGHALLGMYAVFEVSANPQAAPGMTVTK